MAQPGLAFLPARSPNFGRGVGALCPGLVGSLGATVPLGKAIGLFPAGACALMFVAAWLLPETRGRELRATEDDDLAPTAGTNEPHRDGPPRR